MIKNLTPHPVKFIGKLGKIDFVIEPDKSGPVRMECTHKQLFERDGVKFTNVTFGDAINLPPYEEGVFLIVSRIVQQALPRRCDLVTPAEIVKDRGGNVIGCRSLGINKGK